MKKKRVTPEIDWANPLKAAIARAGFYTAAAHLSWVPDPAAALRSWRGYPRSMDIYPTRLAKPGTWWMPRQ